MNMNVRHVRVWIGLFCAAVGLTIPAHGATSVVPGGMDFPADDPLQWTITNTGPTKVQVSVENGAMMLHWPGGPGTAVIEAKQVAPVKEFIHDDFVRYIGQVNILKNVYGSEFNIQILPIADDGKPLRPYFRRHAYYGSGGFQVIRTDDPLPYAPPGQFFRVDFNYRVPGDIKSVRPRFELRGNAVTVAIRSVRIQQGLTWNRDRLPAQPEAREFSEKHVEQILANRPRATPRLVRRDGRVALTIDEKDVFPACYTRGWFYPQYAQYGLFTQAGYDLIRLHASFGPLSPQHKEGVGGMWKGKGEFDFSRLAHELKVIANINPQAQVIVDIDISPYRGWYKEHPDSIVVNAKGQRLVIKGNKEVQYGGKPDYTYYRESYYAPSLYGGAYPADIQDAVKHLAKFLQTSDVGKIVFEVDFVGGQDMQIQPWDRDGMKGENHSPAALDAWRAFLRQRYNDQLGKLRDAWQDSKATFDQADIATLNERGMYGKPPARQGIDYNDFISEGMDDFLLGLGKALKEGSNGRLLAGIYFGDSGPYRVLSRQDAWRVMNSPYIDAVRSIVWYQMSGSWHRHNKLNWCELDLRPWMPNSMQYYTEGLHYPKSYFETQVWRFSAMAVTDLRGGYYNFDLSESWYQSPEIIDVFGKVRSGLASALDDSVNVAPAIGIVTDERVPYRLAGNGDNILMKTSSQGLYIAADRSGVPYARYILNDALDPGFKLPKIVILRLPMAMTPDQADVLRQKARNSGSLLVWGYGVANATLEKTAPLAVSGFDAERLKALQGRQIVMEDAGEWTDGLAGQFMGPPSPVLSHRYRWNGWPYVIHTNPGDIVLGRYSETTQAGAVLRKVDGLTQIIIGRPGAVSPQFLRNLAKQVGVTPISTGDDEMRFGSGILAFYADQGGHRTVTLPKGMMVAASPTGHKFQKTNHGFSFDIGYADEAVFKIVNQSSH